MSRPTSAATPIASADDLLEAVRALALADGPQLAALPAAADARALARELMRREILTPYQVNQLLTGNGRSLAVGPYLLLARLGEGGMGRVFQARHRKLGRVVALKLIQAERLQSEEMVRRFRREVQAAARLSHPNIVLALDADEVDGQHYFAMEYVEGTDLARLVKANGPLPVAAAIDHARQAALGLQHAHEQGLVHRDIKPSNLILTNRGVVKILDFGLARLADSSEESLTLTGEGVVMGTPDFLAPEQTLDAHAADIRADLYSLGCTLYVLLTGRVPFPGGSLGQKVAAHQSKPPRRIEELRPGVPPGLSAVVARLMAKRPEDRFATPAEFIADLDAAASGRPLLAAPAPPPAAVSQEPDSTASGFSALTPPPAGERRPAGGPRWGVALSLAVLLCAGAGAGVWWLSRPEERPVERKPEPGPSKEEQAAKEFEEWLRRTEGLAPEELAEAVKEKLRERNRGNDGGMRVTSAADERIVGVEMSAEGLTDLSAIRGLPHLEVLTFPGKEDDPRRPLADLSPLRGMSLRKLQLFNTRVGNLEPLRGMTSLKDLELRQTLVGDLSPLRGLRLVNLDLRKTQVRDLTPLNGQPLRELYLDHTPVEDLSGLEGTRLTHLSATGCPLSDLKPLTGLPLEWLTVPQTKVRDLSPLAGSPLHTLRVQGAEVKDLTPLKKTKLKSLDVRGLLIDLRPLADTAVEELLFELRPETHYESLRGHRALKKLNGVPAALFWKKHDGL